MKRVRYLAILIVLTVSSAQYAFAASSATLQVSANILPFVSIQAVQHVATYRVDKMDIDRGYLDLPGSMTVNLRTNVTTGVPVVFDTSDGARVLIRERGRNDFAEGRFTVVTGDVRPNTPISKTFDFRVIIPGGTRDGLYPLAISVAPTI